MNITSIVRSAAGVWIMMIGIAAAAEWQWSVPVNEVISSETKDHPRAFLWIPPDCKHVRAVVVGQHNMQEEQIFEHPRFRAALGELGFAEIWVTPGFDLFFRFDRGAGEAFNGMMKALAAESGYSELETVPVVPMGHSAAASYPWNFAVWAPDRTLCALSISGQWPFYQDQNTPDWGARTPDGVPGLVTMGEYEDAGGRASVGLGQRVEHPMLPLSMLQEPGGGHFDASDEKIEYLALYLKKAAQYRLGADAKLKPVDPTKTGWLVDRWRRNDPPAAPAAPVGKYMGDPKQAFWFFDGELAKATDNFEAMHRGKKVDVIGFIQNGQTLKPDPKAHAKYFPKFLPMDDGLTIKLAPIYLETMPDGGPDRWAGIPVGSPVGHGTAPITLKRICGSVAQTGPDAWSIRFNRVGMNNAKRSADFWLIASHPGDDEYRSMVQQCDVRFWLQNKNGADQVITFPPIPDQKAGMTSLKLTATSSAGVPVYFYVREGPADMVDNNTMKFTSIPVRAKFPVKVTVVAWQWGRSIEPRLKTAEPVERTFSITR